MNIKSWVGVCVIMLLGRTRKCRIYVRTLTSKRLWRELSYPIVVQPTMTNGEVLLYTIEARK